MVDNDTLKMILAGALAIFLVLKVTERYEDAYGDADEDFSDPQESFDDDDEEYDDEEYQNNDDDDEEYQNNDDEGYDDEEYQNNDEEGYDDEGYDEEYANDTTRGPKKAKNRKRGLLHAVRSGCQAAPMSMAVTALPQPPMPSSFTEFAPVPPQPPSSELTGKNFVDSNRWMSLSTVSAKRNANRQLRADVPIPKNNAISPWMQSTIEQDLYRKPLE